MVRKSQVAAQEEHGGDVDLFGAGVDGEVRL